MRIKNILALLEENIDVVAYMDGPDPCADVTGLEEAATILHDKWIKWYPIDPDNLPTYEVLAACFVKGTYGYGGKLVGYLEYHPFKTQRIICESEDTILENVSHFIDIHKINP